ncbi:MAG: undecaprenyl-phosphate glucose phosphotransferase [Deltaproteobacteria bacterium]|nr:undecaprenyl-phosphate glucose phosphotransferase [Deltaproteobacteria bacterium]
MNRRDQDFLLMLRVVSDIGMVLVAWALAYIFRFSGVFPITKGVPEVGLYMKLLPFVAVIWFVAFTLAGFYRRTRRQRSAFLEALDVLQSCFLATMSFIAFTYVYEEYRYSRVVMGIFAVVHPWLIIAGRSAIRKSLRLYKRRAAPRRTLLIGSGPVLDQALEMMRTGDLIRSEITGVVLVGPQDAIDLSEKSCRQNDLRILPEPTSWTDFFSAEPTATVVFALPHSAYGFLEQVLEQIADQVPDIRLLPDLARFSRFSTGVDVVNGVPVVTINESPLAGAGSLIKRAVDLIGSLTALVVFSPVLTFVGLLVALTSRGPVLYRQERMGVDGKTFAMLKFRSMRVDAEQASGAVWAKPGDDRTTPVGKWLRRTSLDELPQFLNVLRGEMSLVGPRPERPVFVEQFRRKVPGYYLRHKTKAGITGWAQVNGWRGNTSIEKRIECDLYYIQHWSLGLDLKIIFLTVFKGFVNRNAY